MCTKISDFKQVPFFTILAACFIWKYPDHTCQFIKALINILREELLHSQLRHNVEHRHITPLTDIAHNLLAIDLQLDIRNNCEGLQQKFQHAEYFTYDYSANFYQIFKRFSLLFSRVHKLSNDSSYNMMCRLFS